MPYLYFGFEPRNRGVTKLAVKTDTGELEPAEPSKIKVFTQVPFVPIWSLLTGLLGLAVAILSFPRLSYVSTGSEGLMTKSAKSTIPLKTPGLAVVMKKGVHLSVEDSAELEDRSFTSMQFSGRTVWLKDEGTKSDFMAVDIMEGVDPLGPCPSRYLNTHSFRAFLVLKSFTTRVCELFHLLTETSSVVPVSSQAKTSNALDDKWVNVDTETHPEDIDMTPLDFAFKKVETFHLTSGSEKTVTSFLHLSGAKEGVSLTNSGALYNQYSESSTGFVTAGNISAIKSPGTIFKFTPQLALPDPNLIGDIIGRYFLAGLGDNHAEQLENLDLLKTGTAGLRLTRVGEELTHLYKCIEIAICGNTGLVPIFSRNCYEGSILMGGSSKRNFIINGKSFPVSSVIDLKNEMLNVSDHSVALNYIANLFPEEDRDAVRASSSMIELRTFCTDLVGTQDVRDEIIRKAAMLDFGKDPWVINPANLKRCMTLISSPSILDETYPIGRLALFRKDMVLVALSCFGEKTAPSWDIPNGTKCSLSKANPPSPPPMGSSNRAKQKGEISDAGWVMVIRQTNLFSSVDEFNRMASTLEYKSSPSALAKRVGHRVFSRERMAEFWGPMREALRVVNPLAAFEKEGGGTKRSATESSSTEKGDNPVSGKKRRMDF